MAALIRSMPEPHELIATVRTLQDAVDVFRLMKERLGLTNDFCDAVGGLTPGHTDKVLGPSEDKRLGYDTFALFCELFVVEFHAKINMDAVKRMETVWEGRERPLYPNAKVKRISKKLVERAKPYVIRDLGAKGGVARHALLTSKQSIKIARKAARKSSRTKKLSPERRSEIARIAAAARWLKPEVTDFVCVPADQAAPIAPPSPPCELLPD